LSEEEIRFFKAAVGSRRRIFVVLNKHDTVSAEERSLAMAFVRDQLQSFFGSSTPQIISVSARDGLEAKRSGGASRLAASGFPKLESELLGFLLTQKNREFLLGVCDRATRVMETLPSSLEANAAVEKITALAANLGRAADDQAALHEPLASPIAVFPNLQRLRPCEICVQVADRLWDFLCQYQYRISVNHDGREDFTNRGGFCPFHTWVYESVASPYGTCTAFPSLFERLAEELRSAACADDQQGVLIGKIQALLPIEDNCPLCDVRNKAELQAVNAVATWLRQDTSQTLNSLSAICLPHLSMLAAAASNPEITRRLMERQATILQRVSEDMKRYALKQDAVRRFLASQEDMTAAQRALMFLSGRNNVNFKIR
jgi:hypothetical protein